MSAPDALGFVVALMSRPAPPIAHRHATAAVCTTRRARVAMTSSPASDLPHQQQHLQSGAAAPVTTAPSPPSYGATMAVPPPPATQKVVPSPDAHAYVDADADAEADVASPPPPPLHADVAVDPDASTTDPRLIIAAVAAVLVVGCTAFAAANGYLTTDTFLAIAAWFETLGPNGILLYGLLYFFLELIAVPAIPLTLGSGYLFGIVKGTAAVSISSTLAAAAAFLIARYGLRDSVTKLASRYPRFRAMDRAIANDGFKFVLLLRLSPLLPFSISNYLYGLTSVDLAQYLVASWAGMLPGTIAYVSAGAAVSALTDLGSGHSPPVNPILVVVGVIATVGALTMVGRIASQAVAAVEEDVEVEDLVQTNQ